MPVLHVTSSANNAATPLHGTQQQTFEMSDSQTSFTIEDDVQPRNPVRKGLFASVARHTLGLMLLLCVVFLWTLSNFLGSSIFADNSYAKPFFLTYLNTSCFMLCVLPRLCKTAYRQSREGTLGDSFRSTFTVRSVKSFWRNEKSNATPAIDDEEESFLKPTDARITTPSAGSEEVLELIPTARLSLAFCFLWFSANYFAMACLQYTTVASATILTSTSSIWTLLIGALARTERFTWRKLCGVLASLAGIVLISQVDLKSGNADAGNESRALDDFPDKTPYELALGDALALLSAVIYGFYTINLKKTTISAAPKTIHMPTFFGFVGLFNVVLLLPLFPILHLTGLEKFSFPPNVHIWTILLTNSVSSLISDICWAYAMVFTSPLLVTVGLSLTIPLSLVGEMIIQGRFESWIYWVGAMIVVGSFVFVEREEKHEEEEAQVEEEDLGEPGPAIVIEDYDEVQEGLMQQQRNEGPATPDQKDDERSST